MNTVTATEIRLFLVNEECWSVQFAGAFLREVGTEARTADEWLIAAQTYLNTHA